MIKPILRRGTLFTVFMLMLAFTACSPDASPFRPRDISGSRIGGEFHLFDHAGRVQHLAEQKGKLVVVTFGFRAVPTFALLLSRPSRRQLRSWVSTGRKFKCL